MRASFRALAMLATCAALVLLSLAGSSAVGAAHHSTPKTKPRLRTWQMTLAPAVSDLALAQISFPHAAHGASIVPGSLNLDVVGAFGHDYLAAGLLRHIPGRVPRVLLLLANRPTALLDPARVQLRLSAALALGKPAIAQATDPFTMPAAKAPALCNLALHGGALASNAVLTLASHGAPLKGFTAAGALAEGYDAVCKLPYSSTFKADLETTASTQAPPGKTPPTSPTPPTPPTPVPGEQPTETPGGCVPCRPAAHGVCPLAHPATCQAQQATPRHAPAAAH
jgi:hypothetical protein